jgi:hypothetical protein
MGEEVSIEVANLGKLSMVYNFTRDGLIGVRNMGGKKVAFKETFLNDYLIVVSLLIFHLDYKSL